MRGRSVCTMLAMCAAFVLFVGGTVWAARTIQGTVLSSYSDRTVIATDGGGQQVTLKPQQGALITRGQMGIDARKAILCDISPGDRVVAVVNQNGLASSIKAYYEVAKGTLSMKSSDRLFLKDGRAVRVASGARVVLADGRVGKVADLQPGSPLICRLNPSTEEAWMVVASKPVQAPAVPATAAKPAPVQVASNSKTAIPDAKAKGFSEIATAPVIPTSKSTATVTVMPQDPAALNTPAVQPVIKSVTYIAPEAPKARDWMRIDMTGTSGGRAICEVKGLIPRTVMKEISPGEYRASVMVPSGKFVRNEPVLAHLTIAGVDAPTVQASRLLTVDVPSPEPIKVPEPLVVEAPKPEPEPEPVPEVAAAPAPEPAPVVEQPKPEPPKTKAPVVVTSPVIGTKILRTLLVTGTAEPDSNVMVTVTYSNGLAGLLNISGQVSSQLIATGPDGQFQMGPLPLEGPLATRGLIFTVKACYPEAEQPASVVSVFGDRS